MSMDYQNRRDIDRIYTDLYSIDTLKAVTYKDGSENTGRPLDDVIDDLRSEFTPLRTEWSDVVFHGSSFNHFSNTIRLQFRIVGNIVELDGSWKPTGMIPSSVANVQFASIPVQFAPSHQPIYQRMSTGSGMNSYKFGVLTDGRLMYGWYGSSTKSDLPADTRMDVHLMWMI